MITEIHPAGFVTVWLALFGYSIALTLRSAHREDSARALWLVSALIFLAHTLIAMGSAYGWSHRVAIEATAADTRTLTGVDSGAGLWLNWGFAVVWLADSLYWCVAGHKSYRNRARWISGWIHGFLFFMVVNGAIVFVSGPRRYLGVLICAIAASAMAFHRNPLSEKSVDT